VIGPFKPSSSGSHVFILASTGYFSKWDKVIPFREVGAKQVTYFMVPLCQRARCLMNPFLQIEVRHVQRSKNDKAAALAKLAASLTLPDEREIQITVRGRHLLASALDHFDETEGTNVVSIFEVEDEADWRQPLVEYI